MSDCPGHYSHLELALEIINPCFLRDVEDIAQKLCFECSQLLIKFSSHKVQKIMSESSAIQRKAMMQDLFKCQILSCPHCNAAVHKVKLDNGYLSRSGTHVHASTIKKIFSKMRDSDIDLLGFNSKFSRPQDMIMGVLLIPPPSVRPTVITDDSCR